MGRANIPCRPYDVGKGKPPQHSQFKKGQSGNPSGRPKGSHNPDKLISKHLSKKVSITRNSRTEEVTRREALIERLFMEAAKGNAAIARLLLDRDAMIVAEAEEASEAKKDNGIRLTKLLIQLLEASHHSTPEARLRTIEKLKEAPDMDAPKALITVLFGLGPRVDPDHRNR